MIFKLCSELSAIVSSNKLNLYHKLGCYKVKDLLFHFPTNFVERNIDSTEMIDGKIGAYIVEVEGHQKRYHKSRSPYIINTFCHNNSSAVKLIFFNSSYGYLKKRFEIGKNIAISGKIIRKSLNATPQIVHPDIVLDAENFKQISNIESVYPSTKGLSSKEIRMKILEILKDIELIDWLNEEFLKKQNWPTWKEALSIIHCSNTDADKLNRAKTRIAFDELLASQIQLAKIREKYVFKRTHSPNITGKLAKQVLNNLTFKLTNAQTRVLEEITSDQKSSYTMRRLLQGDVGSGKTLVALFASLNAIESGKQVAFMVPTEILARQHLKNIKELCKNLDLDISLLVANMKRGERHLTESKLKSGRCNIVIGTHALFQTKTKFADLGLCIVDEQHKFGVQQRINLIKKSKEIDFLMMTATPIPRTLAMITFGDLDISTIDEKPPGRKDIMTYVMSENKILEIVIRIKEQTEKEKIYWICPAIDESDAIEIANVTNRYKMLKEHFGEKVGIIHGKLTSEEKEAVMEKFLSGDLRILVATTVVEVGVDVKDATIMIVENSERFGLAQLHQLRGRVGRSSKLSKCILFYSLLGAEIKRRLTAMRKYNDGFELANEDLAIRGAGDIMGYNQTGLPIFKTCDITKHQYLIPLVYNTFKNKNFNQTEIKNLLLLYDHINYIDYLLNQEEKDIHFL